MKLLFEYSASIIGSERLIKIPEHIIISEIEPLIKKYKRLGSIPEDVYLSNDCTELIPGSDDDYGIIIQPVRVCDLNIHPFIELRIKKPCSSSEY